MRACLLPCLALCLVSVACGGEEPAAPEEPTTEPAPETEPETEPDPGAPDTTEACVQGVVVAWQGARGASEEVTRSKEDARARAEELRTRIEGGAAFAEVARAESDGRTTAPRGGVMGTFTAADWPDLHAPLKEAVFQLHPGMIGPVVEADYGYVVVSRCPVEKVHTRHILVRYRGARRAPDDVVRTADAARALADSYRNAAIGGEDFVALAREHSEDSSAERGGDLGPVGRGLLAQSYEEAAFALEPGGVSEVVESPFGFHVIQRVE